MAKKKDTQVTGPRGGTTTVTKSGRIRTVVFLEPEEKRALKIAAIERECSSSDIVRSALRRYFSLD